MKKRSTPTPSTTALAQQRLQRAVTLHQQGQLALAQAAYEDVLRLQPGQADCLHMLGVIAGQLGQFE